MCHCIPVLLVMVHVMSKHTIHLTEIRLHVGNRNARTPFRKCTVHRYTPKQNNENQYGNIRHSIYL